MFYFYRISINSLLPLDEIQDFLPRPWSTTNPSLVRNYPMSNQMAHRTLVLLLHCGAPQSTDASSTT